MAISATLIQQQRVSHHVIIEANGAIMERCISWAANQTNSTVTPMLGFWEDVTQLLGDETFDGVMFDPFPSTITLAFMKESRRLLREGGVLTYYLQQWGNSGVKQWARSRQDLLKAGFTEDEILPPKYAPMDIRSDCGANDLSTCPMQRVTFIIPQIVKGGKKRTEEFLNDAFSKPSTFETSFHDLRFLHEGPPRQPWARVAAQA